MFLESRVRPVRRADNLTAVGLQSLHPTEYLYIRVGLQSLLNCGSV
jgi:hypothetical protein